MFGDVVVISYINLELLKNVKYMKYEKWNLWRIFWFKILQGSKIYVGWHFDMTWYVRSLPLTHWEAMNKEVSLIRDGLRQVSCFCGPNLSHSDMAPDKVTLTVSFFPFTFHPHYCQKHYRDSWGKLSGNTWAGISYIWIPMVLCKVLEIPYESLWVCADACSYPMSSYAFVRALKIVRSFRTIM